MPQQMVLMKEVSTEHLRDIHAQGLVRAAMKVADGIIGGFAMIPGEKMSTRSGVCPPGSICDPYTLYNIVASTVSMLPPMRVNRFALLEVENGFRRVWADEVRTVSRKYDGSDVQIAAAHAFGRGRYNAVVEVVGDEHDAVSEALLDLTDVQGVKGVHLLHVEAEEAFGMGTGAAAV